MKSSNHISNWTTIYNTKNQLQKLNIRHRLTAALSC